MIGASDGVRLPLVSVEDLRWGNVKRVESVRGGRRNDGWEQHCSFVTETLFVLHLSFMPLCLCAVVVCSASRPTSPQMPCHVNAVNETLSDDDYQQGRGFDWSTVTRMNAFQ